MKIAIIDDQQEIRYSVAKILQRQNHKTFQFNGLEEELTETILEEGIELLIVDVMLSDDFTGIDLIKELKNNKIELPIILMTAYTTPENMIEASKIGVKDILQKPFDEQSLTLLVENNSHITQHSNSTKIPIKKSKKNEFIGSFETMQNIYQKIGIAANNDLTVLISGDTGTGKELIANLIHSSSQRASEPFVALNCASIPKELFESQLFGHEKGAFTGADKLHIGFAEQAAEGTLFLDEVGELSSDLQSKLLRFLETKRFRRVGGTKELVFKGRIVSATNANLKKRSEEGDFREDLYFRLSMLSIAMPTLNERKSDIPILSEYFIQKANKELKTTIQAISKEALHKLTELPWKGNIRELRNTIYSACLNARDTTLGVEDFVLHTTQKEKNSFENALKELLLSQNKEELKKTQESINRVFLSTSFERIPNISKLCSLLGVSRNTLKKQLKNAGIYTPKSS